MDLTPVRVRGKRKAPQGHKPAILRDQPKKMRTSLITVRSKRSSRQRATLDSLPTEILESILLYSTNLSLPRATPLIGVKLSDRATLLRLFIWAFHETWLQWFGIPTSRAIFHGPQAKDPKQMPCDGDYAFQSAILDQPWISIDIVLQAQQTWADNYAQGRWYQHCVPWMDAPSKLRHDQKGGFGHFNARECFEIDYQQALKWAPFNVESIPWSTQDVHPRARIPTDLIAGPWDEQKQRLLFWLCRGGIVVEAEGNSPPPWEVKLECLSNAILDVSEPNVLVLNCLIRSWAFTDLPQDIVRKQLVGLKKRIEWGGDTVEGREILRRTRKALDLFSQMPGFDTSK